MKWLSFVIAFLCVSFGHALLTVPQNVRAAAIGDDAFTLRWDAQTEAVGYDVEVMESTEEYLLNTGFEGLGEFPQDWVAAAADVFYAINFPNIPYQGLYVCLIRKDGSVRLPSFNQNFMLRFWVRAQHLNDDAVLRVKASVDDITYYDIGVLQAKDNGIGSVIDTYREFSFPVTPENDSYMYVMLLRTGGPQSMYVDNVRLQGFNAILMLDTGLSNAVRVEDLDPGKNYVYRVRARGAQGVTEYSHSQEITTLSSSSNTVTGSVIDGESVTLDLPNVGSLTSHSMQITPDDPDNADYTVAVNEEGNVISYAITCNDDSALNGNYLITHPGFTANAISASSGKLSIIQQGSGSTNISIDSFPAKGTLTITLEDNGTLPAEIGVFNIAYAGRDYVNLQWNSYSETNLNGYYILRGDSDVLSEALGISPLISATNTSSTMQYYFRDEDPLSEAYYWLKAQDISGESEYWGPLHYTETIPSDPDPDYLKSALTQVYPNPFNPSTNIAFTLATTEFVSIRIFNSRGQPILDQDLGFLPEGAHSYIFDSSEDLPSGIYFLQMQIGKKSYERKLVLMK